jgi:hypothetical protein
MRKKQILEPQKVFNTMKKGFIYKIMEGWAKRHNNLKDFTSLHSGTWFIGLLLMLAVACLAWFADFEVLYGIEFNNTHNTTTSYVLGVVAATIIQVLILICGGMAVKILINKLTDKDNLIQLAIHSLLFVAGFTTTIYLSYQTHSSAKVKGLTALNNTHNTHNTSSNEVLQHYTTGLKQATTRYKEDSSRLAAKYGELIASKKAPLESKIAEKKAKAESGVISWGLYETKKAKYERGIANVSKQPVEEKTKALLSLLSTYTSTIKEIKEQKDSRIERVDGRLDSGLAEAKEATSLAAFSTRWRNVGLNFISFLLCVGLLFFARGANAKTVTKPATTPKTTLSATPLGMMSGIPLGGVVVEEEIEVNNTLPTPYNPVATPTTPTTTTPKKHKGGTIGANEEDIYEVLEDGSCVVLYKGLKGDSWRDRSYVKSQISNRTKKALAATTPEGELNNKAWSKLWEKKLALIKRVEERGDV